MPSPSAATSRVVLGVDPGFHLTGYGILQMRSGRITPLDYGVIKLPTSMPPAQKLCTIQESLRELSLQYSVEAMAVETQFVYLNPASALKLGMVRGVALALAHQLGLDIYEYAPTSIKKMTTGRGRASKQQMQAMIAMRLGLTTHAPEDASDALAMALCHLSRQEFLHPHPVRSS